MASWEEFQKKLRTRFLPPEGEMKVVAQWQRLQQTGTIAVYADHVYKLQAMCSMQQGADFKLAFSGLRPEIQREVQKHMRKRNLQTLPLDSLFQLAADAELGMGRVVPRTEREPIARHKERSGRGAWHLSSYRGARVNYLQVSDTILGRGAKPRDYSPPWNSRRNPTTRKNQGRQDGEHAREACAVCDAWGHHWMACTRKRSGKGCA